MPRPSRLLHSLLILTGLLFASGLAHALTWEMAFRGLGSGLHVEVHSKTTGLLLRTYSTVTGDDPYHTNFRIDFAGAFGSDCQVSLEPETTYVLVFQEWSRKACYVRGHEIDPNHPPDDIYDIGINPDHLNLDTTIGDGYQEAWGFPTATYGPPPPPCPSLSLVVYDSVPIGDKTKYLMRCTATGCSPYTFSWSNAVMTTSAGTNPSLGYRVVFGSQTATVTVTCNGVQKSITVGGPLEP